MKTISLAPGVPVPALGRRLPTKAASGDANRTLLRFSLNQCPLGIALIAVSPQGVCALFLGDEPEPLVADLRKRFPKATLTEETDARFDALVRETLRQLDTPGDPRHLPLDLRGTPFQQSVWGALREIPAGSTTTYLRIAEKLGRPKAFRAVAQACGANPIAIVVPCHRVIAGNGSLSGYRWGVERKRALLERESASIRPSRS
ncbi:MAG TPA: methylated-DNA--[protein]-cysteine S-methyltransferase [Chthoniobacteraceae bacterium]|nr:methylated-DNA--[protein]-cysteine S-methyltransferase [Chthoniobacteraceae bacterium]